MGEPGHEPPLSPRVWGKRSGAGVAGHMVFFSRRCCPGLAPRQASAVPGSAGGVGDPDGQPGTAAARPDAGKGIYVAKPPPVSSPETVAPHVTSVRGSHAGTSARPLRSRNAENSETGYPPRRERAPRAPATPDSPASGIFHTDFVCNQKRTLLKGTVLEIVRAGGGRGGFGNGGCGGRRGAGFPLRVSSSSFSEAVYLRRCASGREPGPALVCACASAPSAPLCRLRLRELLGASGLFQVAEAPVPHADTRSPLLPCCGLFPCGRPERLP